ncbi:MAG: type II toxin-antitoxin system RatA family toxin [Saccharospirillaceae bacterium]|nr:type II toxin-antitoxin system RatA family toxin [Pseudomonadales bacterium]NRB80132.1 type II toxin-antitoxin system RatA family toxin [Saccharospirillaceae bacterium]
MTQVKREALVMYSAKQMYDIVNDVNAYSTFLPNCQSSTILEQSDGLLVGQLKLGKGALNITFTTKNILSPFESIKLSLHDGPFKNLNGVWYFESLNDTACKIRFELSFQANALFQIAAKTLLTQMADQMVQSFVKRAEQIYSN